jgi:predicted O-linked N-acetylglucosamine transferase (SPINDLY family)
METETLIRQALGHHQRGQLEQAGQIYEQALHLSPRHFAALQFLGMLRAQQGRQGEATRLMQAALALRPGDLGALINYGQVMMGSGRAQDALASFEKALVVKPDAFEALYNRAVALAQLKRPAEAIASFDKSLALRPDDVNCLYNRGLAQSALGQRREALDSYDRVIAIVPNFTAAWHNRGGVLRELDRPAEALQSYDKALALAPQDPLLLYSRGATLSDLGRFWEAVASFDKTLAIDPQFLQALNGKAGALLKLEQFQEALENFDQALRLKPDDAEMLNNRGAALWNMKRPVPALESYDKALAIDAGHLPTLLNRALLLQEIGDLTRALADYNTALRKAPDNARAWNGRGGILHALKRGPEALADFDKAIGLDPHLSDALANRGALRWILNGDYTGAVADLTAALDADPNQTYARGELLHLKMFGADWEDYEKEKALIDRNVRQGRAVVRPFVYQALSPSPADLQACSRLFAERHFPQLEEQPSFRPSHDKIRIGYVSGEFREQATAYLMAGLYERHDRSRFEVIAIDNSSGGGSAMRRRLEEAFDKILTINQMSDTEAAAAIRAAEIDILVNLNGYFGAPRMGIFARRAAPIQVNYLGFPGTLGAPYMDYIIADRIVIPEDEQRFYDEQVVYLPHSYQVNDDRRRIASQAPSRAALGLPEKSPGKGFVFCNFNQSYKLTPDIFACWMRILKEVEGSVLWLLSSRPPFEANLKRAAQQQGIAPERLCFASSLPLDQHLARLKQADLFLDNLPCNAHTTASDALWAGLPLLTCRGGAFSGRVAASLLKAVGLPELVTESLEEYEHLAIALAGEGQTLRDIRGKLARNRLSSPLFDTDLFRRHLEAAFTTMWERCHKGEPPRGFSVAL